MPLTDADKVVAKELGLTLDEMRMAKATHIAPSRYAHHKRELQAGRDAENAMMEELASAVTERLPPERRPGAVPPPESE